MPLMHPKKSVFVFFFLDRSYMRLTEKENETLPIDVSCNQIPDTDYTESHAFVFLNTASLVVFSDSVTDFVIICDHLLWHSTHLRRIQRHGCFFRAQKQVSACSISLRP